MPANAKGKGVKMYRVSASIFAPDEAFVEPAGGPPFFARLVTLRALGLRGRLPAKVRIAIERVDAKPRRKP
jgi:hypothetical protein